MFKIANHLTLSALVTMAALAPLTSCTKDPQHTPQHYNNTPIQPIATINPTATKAALGNEAVTALFFRLDETAAGVWQTSVPAALGATLEAGSATRAITFDAPQTYPANLLKTQLWGVCAKQLPTNTPSDDNYKFTLSDNQDIILSPLYQGDAKTKLPDFQFKHVLSQLQFYIYTETVEISDFWGKITNITVSIPSSLYSIAKTTAGATFNSSEASIALTPPTPAKAPVGLANAALFNNDVTFIPPQTSTAYILKLQLTSEKQGLTEVTFLPHDYLESTAYRINLKLTATTIIPLTPSITTWVQGYKHPDGSNDIEM